VLGHPLHEEEKRVNEAKKEEKEKLDPLI